MYVCVHIYIYICIYIYIYIYTHVYHVTLYHDRIVVPVRAHEELTVSSLDATPVDSLDLSV